MNAAGLLISLLPRRVLEKNVGDLDASDVVEIARSLRFDISDKTAESIAVIVRDTIEGKVKDALEHPEVFEIVRNLVLSKPDDTVVEPKFWSDYD